MARILPVSFRAQPLAKQWYGQLSVECQWSVPARIWHILPMPVVTVTEWCFCPDPPWQCLARQLPKNIGLSMKALRVLISINGGRMTAFVNPSPVPFHKVRVRGKVLVCAPEATVPSPVAFFARPLELRNAGDRLSSCQLSPLPVPVTLRSSSGCQH